MGADVFTYGSLQIPAVMHAVCRGRFECQPALLLDYGRHRLRRRCYPGLRQRAGACTEGTLYRGVGPRALQRLDRFEDDFYRRCTVRVIVGAGTSVPAEVYLIPRRHWRLLQPFCWSLQEFRRHALTPYLRRCRRGLASRGHGGFSAGCAAAAGRRGDGRW